MKVKNILKSSFINVCQVDYYTPISINFESDDRSKLGRLNYYRWRNRFDSLIEITVNELTNKIIDITVVSINNICFLPERLDILTTHNDCQLIIDTSIFSETHTVTSNTEIKIFEQNKKIIMIFGQQVSYKKLVLSQNVSVFVDVNNNIRGLCFSNFSDDEWSELSDVLTRDSISNHS